VGDRCSALHRGCPGARVHEISEAEIWFVYLDGKVAAIARYEAV
jgi:hypothetical protein